MHRMGVFTIEANDKKWHLFKGRYLLLYEGFTRIGNNNVNDGNRTIDTYTYDVS